MSTVLFNLQTLLFLNLSNHPLPASKESLSGNQHEASSIFHRSLPLICCHLLAAFPLSKSNSFLFFLLPVIHCFFHNLSKLAFLMASSCLEIVLILFGQHQKHSPLCCLRDAFCHDEVSAWKGCQVRNQSLVHNNLVENWIVGVGRRSRTKVWLYLESERKRAQFWLGGGDIWPGFWMFRKFRWAKRTRQDILPAGKCLRPFIRES